jgi:CRP/FNR family transcriptional regulator
MTTADASPSPESPRLSLDELLDDSSETITLPAHEPFVSEGDPATWIWRIHEGNVREIKLMADGRQQIVGFPKPGQWFGLAARGFYCASAETTTRCRLERVRREVLERLLDERPDLQRAINHKLAAELAHAQDQIVVLGRMTARERLVHFLLDRARQTAGSEATLPPAGTEIQLPMTRGDIADYLGLTVETTSRLFSRMRADGLIDWPGRHSVVLEDPEGMVDTAGMSPRQPASVTPSATN